MNSIATQVIY